MELWAVPTSESEIGSIAASSLKRLFRAGAPCFRSASDRSDACQVGYSHEVTALFQVILIDVALAGDNAIV